MHNLQAIRKKHGISQAKLSEETKIPLRTLQHWELGNTIKPEKAKLLADYFKVPVSTLLGYDDENSILIKNASNYINAAGRLKLTNITSSSNIKKFEENFLKSSLDGFEKSLYGTPEAKLNEFYRLLSSLTPPYDLLVAKFALLPDEDKKELNNFANYLLYKSGLKPRP